MTSNTLPKQKTHSPFTCFPFFSRLLAWLCFHDDDRVLSFFSPTKVRLMAWRCSPGRALDVVHGERERQRGRSGQRERERESAGLREIVWLHYCNHAEIKQQSSILWGLQGNCFCVQKTLRSHPFLCWDGSGRQRKVRVWYSPTFRERERERHIVRWAAFKGLWLQITMPSAVNGGHTVHDRQHIWYGMLAPPAAAPVHLRLSWIKTPPWRPVVHSGISQVLAETRALVLQREEWIKCSAHVLHGASLLQFRDMINLQLRGISPGEFN